MKQSGHKKFENENTIEDELDQVKKELKKKEVQITILKKIIENNNQMLTKSKKP